MPRPFEAWSERFLDTERFDPALWCVVRAGDEIAAGTISTPDTYGGGWVHAVFTRRPWRKPRRRRRPARDAFRRLYDAGERSVGLGVDAGSDTGAFRLYERAGMAAGARLGRLREAAQRVKGRPAALPGRLDDVHRP